MKVEPPRQRRVDQGASLDRPSAHCSATPPPSSLLGNPAATLAAPSRRGVTVVGRGILRNLYCPATRRSCQHHLCRLSGLRPRRPALLAADATRWRAGTVDHRTTQGQLAFGRAISQRSRFAVGPLVVGQTPRLADPKASGEGHQPRAPAEGAQKRGICLRRVLRKLLSNDPQRRALLRRLKRLWRQRRRGRLLAFFDAQPITVKASGGRRYTPAKQRILTAQQQTRGRFYLFTRYEVKHGWVRWAFFPGKGTRYVCPFLRRLRRWYPTQPVRIALDQDPAHPCQAKQPRRLLRPRRLRWTSLPKGSPDDNPVETLCSAVHQAVLHNRNDRNAQATQRRSSAPRRSRNRRKDRFLRISYLGITPKNR
jgi:DDE superfamily endonuclease